MSRKSIRRFILQAFKEKPQAVHQNHCFFNSPMYFELLSTFHHPPRIALAFAALSIVLTSSTAAQSDRPRVEKDRGQTIKLQSTITADKEQPAVSYFVPWKGTEGPDSLNWNIENKYDDTLDIVDRDVLLRSMTIYDELEMESQ